MGTIAEEARFIKESNSFGADMLFKIGDVLGDIGTAIDIVNKKVYTAFITQTGTNAPTEVTVLKDTIGTPVWAYSAVGTYTLTKEGAFVTNKTVPNKAEVYTDVDGNLMSLERTSADVMTLKTYAAADTETLANGVITGQFINIEVYN
jgi:hypothetical protein